MGNKLFEDPVVSQELTIVKKSPFGTIDRMIGIYYKKNIDLSVGSKSFIQICKDFWK